MKGVPEPAPPVFGSSSSSGRRLHGNGDEPCAPCACDPAPDRPSEKMARICVDSYCKDASNQQTRSLAQAIRQHGWPAGFEAFVNRLPESQARGINWEFWPRHTGWRAFMDPGQRNEALVVDATLGSAAIALAQDFVRVHALYTDPNLMKAVQARTKWLGTQNIVFHLRTDLFDAEFVEGSLDAVVVYGQPARGLPDEFFRRCAVWLGPAGKVYVACQNRLKQRMPFSPLRCRKIRPLLPTLLRAVKPHFSSVKSFRYHADLLEAQEISPLDGRRESLKDKLKSIAAPLMAPAFAVLASKALHPHSLVDDVMSEVQRQYFAAHGTRLSPGIRRWLFANPSGFNFVVDEETDQNKKIIVRIPFEGLALERQCRNYAMLGKLHGLPTSISRCVPKQVVCGAVRGHRFFVESMLDGKSVTEELLANPSKQDDVVREAISWITQLHRATAQPHVFDENLAQSLVVDPLRRAFALLMPESLGKECHVLEEFLTRSFLGRELNLTFSHGDYSVDNVRINRNSLNITGVFDWDLATEQEIPFLDVFYFLFTVESLRQGCLDADVFGNTLFPLRLAPSQLTALEHYRTALNIPAELVFPCVLLTWIHHLANRIFFSEVYRFDYFRAQMTEPALTIALEMIKRP